MLVVLVVVDVVADVMQKSGVSQKLPVGWLASEPHAERVEELQRQLLDVLRVRRFVVRPLGELEHGPLARLTGIGDGRRYARRLEQDSFANPVRGDHQLARLHPRDDLRNHGKSGDDDVGARRRKAGHTLPLACRHRVQDFDDVLEIHTRHDGLVNRARAFHSLSGEIDPGEVGGRSAGADESSSRSSVSMKDAGELSANVLSQSRETFAAPVGQKLLGHSNCAERQRDQALDESVGAERQLERSTADVENCRPANAKIEMGEGAPEAERSLVFAVDDSDAKPCLFANQVEEKLAVARCANGACGNDLCALWRRAVSRARPCGRGRRARSGSRLH